MRRPSAVPLRRRWPAGGGRAVIAVVVLGTVGCAGAPPGPGASGSGAPATATAGPGAGSVMEPGPAGTDATPALAVRWVATLSGPSDEDEIDGVAAAPDGSVYLTGTFERSTVLAGTALESAGRADIPVALLAGDGSTRWVQRFGGPGEDNFFDIDAGAEGAVAAGWFEGTVDFGDVSLTSAGSTDCAVVALDPQGGVRWARAFGGPGPDGCNEIVVAADGSVTTTMDTTGGWAAPEGDLPSTGRPDSLVLRLDPAGTVVWTGLVAGPGRQRAKAVAVGPAGEAYIGGDSVGPIVVDGDEVAAPGSGADAWLTAWSATGDPTWVEVWGGPGDDLVKGVAEDAGAVYAVGPVVGSVDVAGTTLDAGDTADLAVVSFEAEGGIRWVTSVRAGEPLVGAEVATAPGGGVLFGSWAAPGTALVSPTGRTTPVDATDGGTAWLGRYRPDGSVAFARTIAGTTSMGPDEISRVGDRVYTDLVLRGSSTAAPGTTIVADGKDGSLWAIDLVARG